MEYSRSGAREGMRERSEVAFDLLIKNSTDLICEITLDGTFMFVNPAYRSLTGFEPSELLGRNALELIHPEDHALVLECLQQETATAMIRSRHKDGTWRWFECRGQRYQTSAGEWRAVVISRDVTARIQTEQRHKRLAALVRQLGRATDLQAAARGIADATKEIFSWDAFSLVVITADGAVRPVLTIDEALGPGEALVHQYEEIHPSLYTQQVLRDGSKLILRTGQEFNSALQPFGNISRPSASLMFAPIRDHQSAVGMISVQSYRVNAFTPADLSFLEIVAENCASALDRIRTQRLLEQSTHRFEGFVERSPALAWIKDEAGRFQFINETFEKSYGLTRDRLIGRTDLDYLPPAVAREFQEQDALVRESNEPRAFEMVASETEGKEQSFFVWKFPLAGPGGERWTGGLAFDITEQQEIKKALLQTEARFHTFIETAPLAICISIGGKLTYVNKEFLRIYALESGSDLSGRTVLDFVAPECRAEVGTRMQRRVNGENVPHSYETTGLRADGKTFPNQVVASIVELKEGRAIVAFIRDLSEQRELESRLRQAQRLESVGRLAGGVAHDFNNILTVIMGNTFLLREGQAVKTALEEIESATEKAANLTKQLLVFSRKQPLNRKPVQLNEVVKQMTRLLKRVIGEDIELDCITAPELPLISADSGMLDQIIMNLAVNARDAMPKGGRLVIETALVKSPPKSVQLRPGTWIHLRVTDTGSGIEPEHIDSIFEPFFTTKEPGKGTGLGLATVYGIVKQHGGAIRVQSKPGEGAAFDIYLPSEPMEGAEETPLPEIRESNMRKDLPLVLVVEDDEKVRSLARLVLIRGGFRVVEARNGREAIDIYGKRHREIAVVLTDIVMPEGMSGVDVVEAVRRINPASRVVFTSGYNPYELQAGFKLPDDTHFLPKPYGAHILVDTINKALETPASQ